ATCVHVVFFSYSAANVVVSTLSLRDALPICTGWTPRTSIPPTTCTRPSCRRRGTTTSSRPTWPASTRGGSTGAARCGRPTSSTRSEEHTSELQSRENLVCRLLLEKKKYVNEP